MPQTKISSAGFSLALVTGASSGIGAEVCRLLASKNIPLMITGRDAGRLNALAEELKPLVNVFAFTADITQAEGRARIVGHIRAYHPNLVINNAGFGLYGEALTYATKEQLEIVNVNATAVLELTLESARAMLATAQKGVILNVSSAAAKQVFPCLAVYAASKSFVNQVSEALDFEMQPHGIRVLTSCPGMVSTDFSARAAGQPVRSTKRGVMTSEFAAKEIWRQIENEKRVHIFDWKTRWATYLSFCLPTSWVAALLSRIIESRHAPRSIITQVDGES